MAFLVVQKFGGTSVGTIDRIRHVARWALDAQARGEDIVLVVSAMSGETNRLVELALQIHPIPDSPAYDLLVSSGEQISVGLVTLAINTEAEKRGLIQKGQRVARGLLGHQIGLLTDSFFSKARIQAMDTTFLKTLISQKIIPVIAGFQGVDSENNITTLGRGGSDTSAVAIAAALQADLCEIYTDVDGVYTTDPRLCQKARKIKQITYEEMMELASLGAKVLQIRSVELAAKYQLPLHVRSSFEPTEGTQVVSKEILAQEVLGGRMEQVVVAGVAADRDQVKFTLQNIPDAPGEVAKIFGDLSEAGIVVDVIVQNVAVDGHLVLSFTVGRSDFLRAREVLNQLQQDDLPSLKIQEEEALAKVSIVGVGMQHHPGVAAQMFKLLADAEIPMKLITTSEIKISCLIPEKDTQRAVECLHQGFALHLIDV